MHQTFADYTSGFTDVAYLPLEFRPYREPIFRSEIRIGNRIYTKKSLKPYILTKLHNGQFPTDPMNISLTFEQIVDLGIEMTKLEYEDLLGDIDSDYGEMGSDDE